MKFNCGETRAEKRKRVGKWHLWFAWHPVCVGPHDCRWLEFVWRRGTWEVGHRDAYWLWDYKPGECGGIAHD
jgi:hypothetical protein